MKNNRGTSLIELIIVMAILAVLAGSTLGVMNYIKYANTKKCAYEINSMIDKVRLQAMSKADKPCLYLYQHNGNYYMKSEASGITNPVLDNTGSKLANNQVQLYYRTSAMASTDADILIKDATPSDTAVIMKLAFVKDTGGIALNTAGGSSYYINKILIKDNKGNIMYTITLIQATGKHEIES